MVVTCCLNVCIVIATLMEHGVSNVINFYLRY